MGLQVTVNEALDELRKVAAKHPTVGDTWLERVVHELDLREERILDLEMEVAYWKERYDDLKADAA